MNLQERLEVIAADYYTKAMAIRTTIQILNELVPKVEKKSSPKVVKKSNKVHWTQTTKGKALMRRRMKALWKTKWANRANKDNG